MLVPPFQPASDWAESLAENLFHPSYPISIWEAFGRRFRRNYFWIYIILSVAWLAKIWLLPPSSSNWVEFLENASIGSLPGLVVLLAGLIFNISLFLIGIATTTLHQASGEVLPRFIDEIKIGIPHPDEVNAKKGGRAWFRPSRRRQQYIALVVTDQAEGVSSDLMKGLNRGITAIPATGMYTHKEHTILLCALTVTEINHLKALVQKADPRAFVIVSPANEILGKGFLPLDMDGKLDK